MMSGSVASNKVGISSFLLGMLWKFITSTLRPFLNWPFVGVSLLDVGLGDEAACGGPRLALMSLNWLMFSNKLEVSIS